MDRAPDTAVDLAGFLLARTAEDEAVARATGGQAWRTADPDLVETEGGYGARSRTVAAVGYAEDRAHIARHHPSRVLAQCVAVRRVVARYREWEEGLAAIPADHPGRPERHAALAATADVLRLLAVPYADHPGYRLSWRP